ncbi:hypothetical protein P678_1701 [Acinetobacter baumannii UH7807]|nr:hypothetical protein P670_0290 [Acinetobacter baumannii UH5707]ETR19139.1 hypothetical protein P678_1701 [Acinetobacter baumannii UH7807]
MSYLFLSCTEKIIYSRSSHLAWLYLKRYIQAFFIIEKNAGFIRNFN